MKQVQFYYVGGYARDTLLKQKAHDVDYAVVAPTFQMMLSALKTRGFDILNVKPSFGIVRAREPQQPKRVCDIKWCYHGREEITPYTKPYTIEEDLRYRDFTINAMAMHVETKALIDPYGGMRDLERKCLRCPNGNAKQTLWEMSSDNLLFL